MRDQVAGACGPAPACLLSCSTHMQDLQEVTQDLHYENFRSERLKRGGRSLPQPCCPLCPVYPAQLTASTTIWFPT